MNLRELFAEPSGDSGELPLAWAAALPTYTTSFPDPTPRDFDTQAARTFADDLDVVSAQAEVVRLNDAARGLPVPGDRGRRA